MKKICITAVWVMWVFISAAAAAEPVKIGVAAMISPRETVRYYKQLIDYIGAKLGLPVEMVHKESYDEMDSLLENGSVPVAFICSGPYVKDHTKFGVELLAAPQSYGRPFYHAYIITHKSSPLKDISGLRGKRFAFTDPKSNTGSLVPTYVISKEFRTRPDKFFSEIMYTKSHDKSIEAVAKKVAEGASVDSLIYDYALKKNPVYASQTKIIWKSSPYGIPPLVIRKDADPALKNKIRNILLNMDSDPAGKAILDGIMVDKFIIPKDSDYNTVREMEEWLLKRR